MESTSISGSSKRARAPGNITQVAHCLVDGCNADLSQSREYHRRHKVCEMHSKTAKVTIGGREQRFCQQCSRFHSLVEFDEGKRSCRKRLDGHNRRRRKPQPESLSRNPSLLYSNPQGARLLSFGSREAFTNAIVSSTWGGIVNANNDTAMYSNHPNLNYFVRQNSYSEGSGQSYKGVNQIQFMQSTERTLPEPSVHTTLLDPNYASADSNFSQKTFSAGLNQVFDSDRALSLLSSASSAVTREIGLSHHMVQPDSMHHGPPSLTQNLNFNSLDHQYPFAKKIESKEVISVTDSHVSNNSNLHFQDLFQNGQDGSSTSGSHQTLTFMWE